GPAPPLAAAADDGAAVPFAAAAVVADHRSPVLDGHAVVAAVFASVMVGQGDTTREAESECGQGEKLEHHALG
ncbi:MAG TPA: hypothetical protein VF516_04325, partial [Kofleriaceae bacterium]